MSMCGSSAADIDILAAPDTHVQPSHDQYGDYVLHARTGLAG
jgi:hypothetical protein